MIPAGAKTILEATEWRERAAAHDERARRHTQPARGRRDRREPHPIADFLFEYYPFPFSLLEKWQPGLGFALEWPGRELQPPFCDPHYVLEDGLLALDPQSLTAKERQRLAWMTELLEATRDRAPNFGCHGLHEWAMVYRGGAIRHERTLSLRILQREIDEVVETRPICCSHHDAFRFFAPEAKPFNHLDPSMETRHLFEQPACLHANMDLYKWAAKAMPWTGSELLLDCFELAVELRDLDMRASPYDLSDWGLEAVRIELPDGRREYETEQRRLAARAITLRDRLIGSLKRTLDPAV